MILVVLFTVASEISILFGLFTMTTGNLNGPSILASAPVFLVAIAFEAVGHSFASWLAKVRSMVFSL